MVFEGLTLAGEFFSTMSREKNKEEMELN